MPRTWPVLALSFMAATCGAGETEWRSATNEPGAAKLWLHPGVRIETVLDSLMPRASESATGPSTSCRP
jgi:hypothetical protein